MLPWIGMMNEKDESERKEREKEKTIFIYKP